MATSSYPDSAVFRRGIRSTVATGNDPPTQESLESLMARYITGDRWAFDAIYARTCRRILQYFEAAGHNRDAAEQLCVATYLRIHRARIGYLEGTPALSWLMAIARRTSAEQRARRA